MCEEDSWIETVCTYPPARIRAGVDAIVDTVRSLGLGCGTIGAELGGVQWMRMPFEDFRLLQNRLPEVGFVDASAILWAIRGRKSPGEMAYVRRAVSITDGTVPAAEVVKTIRP